MAGVTDRPFRQLCKRLGAGLAVSEMMSSQPHLRESAKSRRRADHAGEVEPICVQIAGADPAMMADAARYNVGAAARRSSTSTWAARPRRCATSWPAPRCCGTSRWSAASSTRWSRAVDVPVTLKIRTGWDPQHRNAVRVARIAQSAGIRLLAVHGRTRACGFTGSAEYDTIAAVKNAVSIPVVANGDIDSPEKARDVLAKTGADALMIGRAAQGRPWIFREIGHFLRTGEHLPPPEVAEIRRAPARASAGRCTPSTARSAVCVSRASTSPGTRSTCGAARSSGSG